MAQSPYDSIEKSVLYAILAVLLDVSEHLNVVTDCQYAVRVISDIKTTELIAHYSELTLWFNYRK